MMEDIEKRKQRAVLGPEPIEHQLGIAIGKRAHRAREAHEIHLHPRRLFLGPIELLDLAGGKSERGVGAKMHGLVFRVGEAANRPAIGPEPLEKRDRLEELERAGIFPQQFGER